MASSTIPDPKAEFVPEFFLRELKSAARKGEFTLVETLLADYETQFARDAFYAEALSWVARSAASKGFHEEAGGFARAAYDLAIGVLGEQVAEASSPLALAVGAAIEVESQLRLAGAGEGAAVDYLDAQLKRFAGQPFSTRIRKNLHLVALAGQPAPVLDWAPLPESSPGDPAMLERTCLLFFWAHWCSDSRAQARTLARLRESGGLSVPLVAPTRLFGYLTKGTAVDEETETAHALEIRKVDYPVLADAPIPFGSGNFNRYGVSTFPTLVGIQAEGRVGFFHPGTLKADDLAERLRGLQ